MSALFNLNLRAMKLQDFKRAFGIGSISFGKTSTGRLIASVPLNGEGMVQIMSTTKFDPKEEAYIYRDDKRSLYWLSNKAPKVENVVTL